MTDPADAGGALTYSDETDAAVAHANGFTAESAPLYSLWKRRGDEVASMILGTEPDGSATYVVHIRADEVAEAVAAFVEKHGAPAFEYTQEQQAYVAALEQGLRAGMPPIAARDAALASLDPERRAEYAAADARVHAIIKARIAAGEFPDLAPPPAPGR